MLIVKRGQPGRQCACGAGRRSVPLLSQEGFDPEAGLFLLTSDNELYPRPDAAATAQGVARLRTLGALLGKAMFEGLVVEVPLAGAMHTAENVHVTAVPLFRVCGGASWGVVIARHPLSKGMCGRMTMSWADTASPRRAGFVLKKVRGAVCDINDLPSLDRQLHASLTSIMADAQVESLNLRFTIARATDAVEVPLLPGPPLIPPTVQIGGMRRNAAQMFTVVPGCRRRAAPCCRRIAATSIMQVARACRSRSAICSSTSPSSPTGG